MSRGRGFALLATACIALAVGYVGWRSTDAGPAESAGAASRLGIGDGRIVFQNVIRDTGYAMISSVPATRPRADRTVSRRKCERVHFSPNGGICLLPRRDVVGWSYDAILLDRSLRERRRIGLPGLITRARISGDGRYAAATGFVTGDSYADDNFSTRTFILDARRGRIVAGLEEFAVVRDGRRIDSIDFNFWGVTFARDSNRFYATLGTRGRTYLVRGDIARRRVDVVTEGVECPSLSPDGTRIAFKTRVDSGGWRLSVLDLRTMARRPLAETRSVDDQVEWLDDDAILYGLDASIWTVSADGTGRPRELIAAALSPAVVRVL